VEWQGVKRITDKTFYKDTMQSKLLELTNEEKSPLFRIMWVHNVNEPQRRQYENNICAFHIGNGFILSVAHNLRGEAKMFKSIEQDIFEADILPHLNSAQILLFDKCYPLDSATGKRYLNIVDPKDAQVIMATLMQINFDTRWLSLMQKNICTPHLIIQFKKNLFYNDPALTSHFDANTYFHEPGLNRHTFLVEVELVEAFYQEDIALYKIVNNDQAVINRLPSVEIDYSLLDDSQQNFYCLQSSPSSEVGKLINKAHIEGFLEHFGIFPDRIGGNYTFEGARYLIKGYFRFGSSGAPYVFYDKDAGKFKVNAIQSEACPIQLSINNKREGNFQYVNAIASPLSIIEARLRTHLAYFAKR
jgi:hypothetical protein